MINSRRGLLPFVIPDASDHVDEMFEQSEKKPCQRAHASWIWFFSYVSWQRQREVRDIVLAESLQSVSLTHVDGRRHRHMHNAYKIDDVWPSSRHCHNWLSHTAPPSVQTSILTNSLSRFPHIALVSEVRRNPKIVDTCHDFVHGLESRENPHVVRRRNVEHAKVGALRWS